MNTWWAEQNTDEVYFICTENWTSSGYDMPHSATVDDYYWDFGNGYVPFFGVIGAYNVLMYGDNGYSEALAMVPDAVASFANMGVLTPIPSQSMYYGETLEFDITNMFSHPDDAEITVTVSSNSDVNIASAELVGNMLTVTSLSTSGDTDITLNAVGGTLSVDFTFNVSVMNADDRYIVILDLDVTPTGDILKPAIETNYPGGEVYVTNDITAYPLGNADALFVLLGIYSNNTAIDEATAGVIATYLDGGGNVYMEGGDTWNYDTATSVHPYFGISGDDDGGSDLSDVNGLDFMSGMSWAYSGENNYIDQLSTIGSAVSIFENAGTSNICGIANTDGNYHTIGTSFEITGLSATGRFEDALSSIIDFFDIQITEGDEGTVEAPSASRLVGNYPNPFNPTTSIKFATVESGNVTLEIYNAKGQKVKTLVNDTMSADTHTVDWNGTDDSNNSVSSGIYFYKMRTSSYNETKKMVLMK